jgi:hypothetical protein
VNFKTLLFEDRSNHFDLSIAPIKYLLAAHRYARGTLVWRA